jgi:hypothetical protein
MTGANDNEGTIFSPVATHGHDLLVMNNFQVVEFENVKMIFLENYFHKNIHI